MDCPEELMLYLLLQKFPQYTLRTLEQEPAQFVERLLICYREEQNQQAEQQRRQAHHQKHEEARRKAYGH